MKTLFNFLKNFMTSQCPICAIGRVSHSHSEPRGLTTIEVYQCDNCKTQFV